MRGSLPLLSLVLSGGCRSILGIDDVSVARDAGIDGSPDVAPDIGSDAPQCFGTDPFVICVVDPPPAISVSMARLIATTTECGFVEVHQGKEWCVFVARTIVIDSALRAVGSRPLVLLATDTLTISPTGTVSAESREQLGFSGEGPGSNKVGCGGSIAANHVNGAGGGAGGSFGSRGGDGGDGDASQASSGLAGPATPFPSELRGGCAGTPGGDGGGDPSNPGEGGGAVYLIAGQTLQIAGKINASGAAGAGGSAPRGGGGGGGSGGLILLWSPVINVGASAQIFANGGGGGGGASAVAAGAVGLEPTGPSGAAVGGMAGGGSAGSGGSGSFGASPGQIGRDGGPGDAGGGGGGGAGYIRANLPLSGTNFSPQPTT